MTTSTCRSVTVDRDLGTVAAFVLDFTTSAVWDPHTVRCTRLDDGPVRVGARYENVQHLAGHDAPLQYEVVEYEPGRRLVLEGGSSAVHTRDEIDVTPGGDGGTTVTYTVHVDLQGASRLASPVLPAAVRAVADDGERQLRDVLERLPA